MAARGTETVVVSKQAKSRTGDPIPGEQVGELRQCIVWPRMTTEDANRGTVIIEGYEVFAPAPVNIEIKATDVVHVRGKDWAIEGVPGDWRKKNGQKLGLMFTVQRLGA